MTETVPVRSTPEDAAFYLCLTHDVDRVYKTFQRPYEAITERDLRKLFAVRNPYWQFDTIREIESRLGVRSSFYFLSERRLWTDFSPLNWASAKHWMLYAGRYDLTRSKIESVIRGLRRDGWEVGLHGSYTSYDDPDRLQYEKSRLESTLGAPVIGGRQHYLNFRRPQTWQHHREIGLSYDSTIGSSTEYGFQHGYDVQRPFDDEFTVFPLTVMDTPLMTSTESVEEAIAEVDSLLEEARENEAVMTVDWHQRVFDEAEFPGYRTVYVHLIRRALELGAWVGPCGELYKWLSNESVTVTT